MFISVFELSQHVLACVSVVLTLSIFEIAHGSESFLTLSLGVQVW
jgi:hypothetical protein